MKDAYDFGLILQQLRKAKGMTQAQLAKKINKESSIISRYEKNFQSPTFETVREFAVIFNVSMDYLSGMEKESTVPTYGLPCEQIEILKALSELFRQQNESFPKKLTEQQYKLLGRIFAEFAKS
ncbi:MAG TPA: XRE family transcriptional regulator [Ruminococcus sp.]|nr:XRE family transcriptional regulator [Ruminococcus sp.]